MTFITTPLARSFVGFDNLFDELEKVATFKEGSYPAYNIEKTSDSTYEITIALAGFKKDQIEVELEQNRLTISANSDNDEPSRDYVHKGIATRSFTKQFRLAEHVEVKDANFEDGLLMVNLFKNIPEAELPRKIEINKKLGKPVSKAA